MQKDENNHLHLIVFYSQKMINIERNYDTYDQEMLVIIESTKH